MGTLTGRNGGVGGMSGVIFISQPQDGQDREAGEHPVGRHQPLHPQSPASHQAHHGGLRDTDTLYRGYRHH